jgi:hypothetical protein
LVVVRDDVDGGCVIALLEQRHYQGMSAVAGVGRWVRYCRGRRAAVTESTTATRTADNATRGEERMMMTSEESSRLTTQGDNNGGINGGGDVMLRASYS